MTPQEKQELNERVAEYWVEINDYDGKYSISNLGRFRNNMTGRIFTGYMSGSKKKLRDYKCVQLSKDGKSSNDIYIHRLLAIHFIPNPNNYPVVNHIDGNRHNNSLNNLEWCTQKYNALSSEKRNNQSKINFSNANNQRAKSIVEFDEAGNILNKFNSIHEGAEATGISQSWLSRAVKNNLTAHGRSFYYEQN